MNTPGITSPKSIFLTPRDVGGGHLPSGYEILTFSLSDANMTGEVKLPEEPVKNAQVNIISGANYTSYLNTAETDIIVDRLPINRGDNYFLAYNESSLEWKIGGKSVTHLSPVDSGSTIPDTDTTLTIYSMSDGNWTSEIKLPKQGRRNDLIIIESAATFESKVSKDNLLYASTITIRTGDSYAFRYFQPYDRWVVEESPIRNFDALEATSHMISPTSPRTHVSVRDGNWIPQIKLPDIAGDRDRVVIKSVATFTANIESENINNPAIMKLAAGDEYEFLYIAENKKWEMVRHPDYFYEAKDLVDGKLPDLQKPRTMIRVIDGSYQAVITLPAGQAKGSRVAIQTNASTPFWVSASDIKYSIGNGETVFFKVGLNGLWERETITLDMLLLYSDKAAAILGENAMINRLVDGLNLTNEALENSGANFRFRIKGLKQVDAKEHWNDIQDPLRELRSDPVVQGWRDDLKAHGIYYEGTETGTCGFGWIRASAYNMVSVGSISCGTTVMRHELGHNMGLHHGGESDSYNQGYWGIGTIMQENTIPYYATPERYTADYGIPMGIKDQYDSVRAMNEFSATVASYR